MQELIFKGVQVLKLKNLDKLIFLILKIFKVLGLLININ